MESIFHEKQEGSLCAQHCLNALLQNQYFSAVDLAQIGRRLDDTERERMAEGGVGTHEYQRFIEEPSSNFDDSGFFSVQVISEALSVWGLDMVLYNSQDAIAVNARADPTQMLAFICNYHQHWFSVRKLGRQWFNLNSLLSGPELISDTYLALFLTQLQQEGYSIFIVTGLFPECEADQILQLMPAVQTVKPKLLSESKPGSGSGNSSGGAVVVDEDDDGAFQDALKASKEMIDKDDTALQRALQASMEGYFIESPGAKPAFLGAGPSVPSTASGSAAQTAAPSADPTPLSQDELRQKRLAFLDKTASASQIVDESGSGSSGVKADSELKDDTEQPQAVGTELSEEELLQKAISMSMEHT